ncbi:MAG: DUF4347 domain-containing protein [Roseateles sp.]|uniref:DUF4347 domain-containing protein n=1 Tax=Roseateles sp. TaxID=1971397 RepID=UPI0040375B9E
MRTWFKRARTAPPKPQGVARQAVHTPLMMALEPRIMFDAAAVATVVDATHDVPHEALPLAPAAAEASYLADAAAAVPAAEPAAGTRHEIVFVDTRLPDYQQLVSAASPNAEVILLDTNRDGVQQIADALANRSEIDAIHVISHGDAGVLLLGSGPLFEGNLGQYASQLRTIGHALKADGDILLYGCEVGAGSEGQAFLSKLAGATGADVAASTDNTGGRAKGANWELEIATGSIGASHALDLARLSSYDELLVTTSVSTVAQLKAAIATGNTDGVNDTITLTANISFASSADAISINVTDGRTMAIVGGGFTLSGSNLARVLDVSSSGAGSAITIDNLTITSGFVTGAGGAIGSGTAGAAGGDSLGAGIRNSGDLTITNSIITANKAAGGGGGGSQVGGGAGAGGGGGGFGSTPGGAGGANPPHAPGAVSAGTGGNGAGYGALGGRGGSTTGGAGGTYGGYTNGGSGGTANNGSISIGGGGGGAGYDRAGGRGGNAAGGIYNTSTGVLTIVGSAVTNNIGAGGGGGGGAAPGGGGGNGGDAGTGVGAIWNNGGTVRLDSTTNTTLTTGNLGAAGGVGLATKGGSSNGAAGTATSAILTTNGGTSIANYVPNAAPAIANLHGDTVAWAGVGSTVSLDVAGNASLTDAELGALNGGNGNWSGAGLAVQRSGTAISTDTFGFNTSGALFTVSGSNLQSGGLTFATFTNTGGVLTVSFTSSGTAATTALVNDVAQRVTYRNDTPSGDATVRYTVSDGTTSTTADVSVASDTIYVTNATDTATIDVTNGVSYSEAIAIAAADATGSQTIAFAGSLASTTLTVNGVTLGENLTFDLDAASGISITSGTIALGSHTLTLTNGTGDTATLSTTISGTGGITKAGAGTVTLSNASNSATGATTVSAGTLTVTGGNAIASGSAVTVAGGATLALSANEAFGNLSGAGAITLGSSTLTTTLTADTTFSGGISGTGGLSVNQTGAATFALTLSGTNTYTGATTTLNYGWLRLDGDNAVSSSSSLRFNGNSRVTLLSDQTVGSLSSASATAGLDLGSFTVSAGGDNTSTSVAGVISGTGGLVKLGSGTLTLSGSNTYTGSTTASAGTLSLSSGTALANSSAVTVSSGATLDVAASETIGSLAGAGTVTLGANTLTAGGDNTSTTFSGDLSGTGGLTKAGSGTLTLSGTNTYTGATTLSAGGITVTGGSAVDDSSAVTVASGATLTLAGGGETVGSLAGAGNVSLAYTLTSGGDNTSTTFSGVIASSNTSGIVKTGSGTLTLSGSNTYTGSTTVSAGTLSVASDANLGAGIVTLNGGTLGVTGATNIDNAINLVTGSTIDAGAALTLSGNVGGAGNLTKSGASTLTLSGTNSYAGTTTVSAGTLSVGSDSNLGSGTVTLASGTTLAVTGATTVDNALALAGNATVSTSANATLSGIVSGPGNLTKTGASTLTLSGGNTYSGATVVSAGTLSVASDGNLGSGALTLAAGTTLALTGATTVDNAIALSGNATVSTSANATLSGNISGAGGLTKAGASSLTLSGSNTFSGATNVAAGTLLVNGALASTSAVTVASGATLGGSGSISGNTTVNNGGTLAPGNSPGTLTVNGNLTMAAGSTLAVEINGTTAGTQYDQVVVNGAVDVSGATLAVTHGYTPGSGDVYIIIVNDASDAVTGNFSGLSEGGSFNAGGNATELTASYVGLTGNDFTLTAPANPVVTSVSTITPNGTYAIGDTITVVVNFSEAVFLSTGTIELVLETGTIDRTLSYLAGSGSSTLYFSYTVQQGDSSADLDYASTASLNANGDTIQSGSFIDAVLTLPTPGAAGSLGASASIVVDGVRPTASIVVADTALAAGETSLVTITFNEAVTGFTNADLTVANGTLSNVSSADGGVTWTATLTPTAGVTGASNLVTLDNTGVTDAAGNSGIGTTDSNNYAIDGQAPTVTSVVVPANGSYVAGQNLDFTVNLSEAVVVDTTGGTPRIAVTLDTGGTAYASYLAGSGSSALTFRLTVTSGQLDSNGITVASALDPNGATLRDSAGNATVNSLSGIGTTTGVLVDAVVPTVISVGVPASGPYNAGDVLSFTVSTSETVTVNTAGGTPRLALDMGGTTVYADYASGSGSAALLFRYTVQPGDTDANGIAVNGLQGNGGTLRDAAGNDLAPALHGVADSAGVIVDTTGPLASVIVRAGSSPTAAGSAQFTLSFSEAVTGVDVSHFSLTFTGSAQGSIATLTQVDAQTYTVVVSGLAGEGTVQLALNPSGTAISDAAGNALQAGLAGEAYALRPISATPPPVITPPPVEAPPPPPIVSAPSLPPVTLSPTDPITPISTPTLTPTAAPGDTVVVVAGNPFSPDPLAPPSIAPAPAAPANARGGFIEVSASLGSGLQAMPDIGSFSAPAGQAVNIALPDATFVHSDRSVQVSVEVRLADGRPLPAWLKFDPVTGTISGQPPRGLSQRLAIEVIARDSKGNRATSHLEINVKAAPAAPAPRPSPGPQSLLEQPGPDGASLDFTALPGDLPAHGAGRPGLAAQFDRYGSAARQAERDALLAHARATSEAAS